MHRSSYLTELLTLRWMQLFRFDWEELSQASIEVMNHQTWCMKLYLKTRSWVDSPWGVRRIKYTLCQRHHLLTSAMVIAVKLIKPGAHDQTQYSSASCNIEVRLLSSQPQQTKWTEDGWPAQELDLSGTTVHLHRCRLFRTLHHQGRTPDSSPVVSKLSLLINYLLGKRLGYARGESPLLKSPF